MRPPILALAALSLLGCSSGAREAAPAPERAIPTPDKAAPEPAAPVDAGAAPAPESAADKPREGWTFVETKDDVPLCVFASHFERSKAEHPQRAKKQKLAADSEIVFGAFGPGCMNEACDARPTLQCWVDHEGDSTLVVHARFFAEHKIDGKCAENCQPVLAGCPVGPLKAGKYTVKYGDRSFPLKIPSVVAKPCFKLD
jgi:hypothetical protein